MIYAAKRINIQTDLWLYGLCLEALSYYNYVQLVCAKTFPQLSLFNSRRRSLVTIFNVFIMTMCWVEIWDHLPDNERTRNMLHLRHQQKKPSNHYFDIV